MAHFCYSGKYADGVGELPYLCTVNQTKARHEATSIADRHEALTERQPVSAQRVRYNII